MKRYTISLFTALMLGALGHAAAADSSAETDVKAVLSAYSHAIEALDGAAASPLFAPDARVFEQGGDEGSWTVYLEHHLGPEFAEFKSFHFADYKADVAIEGDLAIASETYRYTIEPKEGGEPVQRLGAATSVLRKTDTGWKIIQYHSSSRKPPG